MITLNPYADSRRKEYSVAIPNNSRLSGETNRAYLCPLCGDLWAYWQITPKEGWYAVHVPCGECGGEWHALSIPGGLVYDSKTDLPALSASLLIRELAYTLKRYDAITEQDFERWISYSCGTCDVSS